MQNRIILFLSIPLTALIIIASCIGLLTPDFYSRETTNWKAQCIGQDMIDVFLIAPCLLFSAIMAYRNNVFAALIWGGTVMYLTYTFLIYCFAIHFNKLFVVYCLCLGLSFYAFALFLFAIIKEKIKISVENKTLLRFTGIYFIVIAVLFYLLWLSEIIPSILENKIPKSVTEAGLFTNAVHVIDLSVVLPAIFITGILLLKRNTLGFILTPMLLTFFVLMDITIGMLTVIMKMKGLDTELSVAVIMALLALLSLMLLIAFFRNSRATISS